MDEERNKMGREEEGQGRRMIPIRDYTVQAVHGLYDYGSYTHLAPAVLATQRALHTSSV